MTRRLRLTSAAKHVLVACVVAAAIGAILVAIALGSGLASARDPYIACAEPAQGRAILDEYKEATVVGSQFSFWPLGTRCTYRVSDSGRFYMDPPDWALTITMLIGMSLTAAAVLGAAGVGIVAARRSRKEPMALDPSPSGRPDSIE